MQIIDQKHEFLTPVNKETGQVILKRIEEAARTCYRSENSIAEGSAEGLVKSLVDRGHEAMLEHASISVRFTTNRAIANEMVRHRIASYAQESTRYCNYSKNKFGKEIKVIEPYGIREIPNAYKRWFAAVYDAEQAYFTMLKETTPEIARDVLPLCTATEIVMTCNIREWRNVLRLRCSKAAHPQIRELMAGVLADFKENIPILFDDIEVEN